MGAPKGKLRLKMEAMTVGDGLVISARRYRLVNVKALAYNSWNSSLGAYRFSVTQEEDEILIRRIT